RPGSHADTGRYDVAVRAAPVVAWRPGGAFRGRGDQLLPRLTGHGRGTSAVLGASGLRAVLRRARHRGCRARTGRPARCTRRSARPRTRTRRIGGFRYPGHRTARNPLHRGDAGMLAEGGQFAAPRGRVSPMLVRAPGVYRPQPDTWLLARAMTEAALPDGARVLDACTGTGALAIHAARTGAAAVTAVDLSRAAVTSAWLNSRLHGVRLELLCGDVTEVVSGRTFDVIVANPPYVPSDEPRPAGRAARAWDAGRHGRSLLDPLCAMMPRLLTTG